MIESLRQLGLSEREAKVYEAALRLGQATVETLAKEAGIIRTTAYTQIEALMQRGLLSSLTEGKKTFYVAESPDNLARLVTEQKQTAEQNAEMLKTLLPNLNQIYSSTGKRPHIRYFSGKEGIITMRNEVLKMKGKELRIITAYDDFLKIFSNEKERNEFTQKRKRKNIKTRALYTTATPIPAHEYAPESARRLDETQFPIEFDVYLYDNSVAISSIKEDIWAVIIDSEAVAKSMGVLFEIAWQASA